MPKFYHKILPVGSPLYNRLYRYYFGQLKGGRNDIKQQLNKVEGPLRVNLGSGLHQYSGWVGTEYHSLDLTDENEWKSYFKLNSIDNLLAEHVFEHLTYRQVDIALSLIYKYLKPGGTFRCAVPDAFHPSQAYWDWVKPGSISSDHKTFWDYKSFGNLMKRHGFKVEELEYYDESGEFHFQDFDDSVKGPIERSKGKGHVYTRKITGKGFDGGDYFKDFPYLKSELGKDYTIKDYSSLILDATKPK